MKLSKDIRDFIELLNSTSTEYLVVGGYAVGYHGFPRVTGDFDFFVRASHENALRLIEVFRQFGFEDAPSRSPNVLRGGVGYKWVLAKSLHPMSWAQWALAESLFATSATLWALASRLLATSAIQWALAGRLLATSATRWALTKGFPTGSDADFPPIGPF